MSDSTISNATLPADGVDSLFPHWLVNLSIAVLIALFITQATYLATHLQLGIPPDELHHINVSGYYKNANGFTIVDSPDTYHFGVIATAKIPYLFHLLAGKLSLLNFSGYEDAYFLRFISVICAVLFLLSLVQLLRELEASPAAQILAVIVAINIPMFVFISSAASYDSFINLLALRLQISLIRFFKNENKWDLISVILLLLIGSLAKITFLPFYLITALFLSINPRLTLRAIADIFKSGLQLREKIALITIVLLIALNSILYISNLAKYGAPLPSVAQAIGEENALRSYQQAKIQDELLASSQQRPLMPFTQFIEKFIDAMNIKTFGIYAHKVYEMPRKAKMRFSYVLWPFLIGTAFALIFSLVRFKEIFTKKLFLHTVIIASALFYYAYLAYYNYSIYQSFHVFGVSLQGRYSFPVLANFIAVFVGISLFRLKGALAWSVLLFCAYFFFKYGVFFVIPRLGAEWFIT